MNANHELESLGFLISLLAVLTCYRMTRRALARDPIAHDEAGARYRLQVATTPEDEKVVVAEAL